MKEEKTPHEVKDETKEVIELTAADIVSFANICGKNFYINEAYRVEDIKGQLKKLGINLKKFDLIIERFFKIANKTPNPKIKIYKLSFDGMLLARHEMHKTTADTLRQLFKQSYSIWLEANEAKTISPEDVELGWLRYIKMPDKYSFVTILNKMFILGYLESLPMRSDLRGIRKGVTLSKISDRGFKFLQFELTADERKNNLPTEWMYTPEEQAEQNERIAKIHEKVSKDNRLSL